MKKLIFNLSLLSLLFLSGCNTDNDNSQRKGTLIFGWFTDSNCSGDCSTIYKIDTQNVYKNIDNNFQEKTFFEGNFQLMNNADYQDYKSLIIELPIEIFNEPNGFLDCTECTNDNGGFYIEYQGNDGFHKSWRFRNAKYPDYLKNYRSLLLDKLAKLNNL
ncbi:hypothetical protein [Flavobacterium faecale]|uniref:hypothetical protein n=1 Tax=Flavobacterium faecale TaxID=1355330 RepID=UPI003AAB9A62